MRGTIPKEFIENFRKLTYLQKIAFDELQFIPSDTQSSPLIQAGRFQNQYQVVAFIVTNNVELSLSFNSLEGIIEHFRQNPADIGMANLRALLKIDFYKRSPHPYSQLVNDLEERLGNLIEELQTKESSSTEHETSESSSDANSKASSAEHETSESSSDANAKASSAEHETSESSSDANAKASSAEQETITNITVRLGSGIVTFSASPQTMNSPNSPHPFLSRLMRELDIEASSSEANAKESSSDADTVTNTTIRSAVNDTTINSNIFLGETVHRGEILFTYFEHNDK